MCRLTHGGLQVGELWSGCPPPHRVFVTQVFTVSFKNVRSGSRDFSGVLADQDGGEKLLFILCATHGGFVWQHVV